jgi:DNA replication protein DnaC
MSRAATTRTVGDQITTLLTGFTLTTAAREMVSRFVQAEQQGTLPLLLDVLQLEAQERHERRITRLRRASKLPPGKTFDTFDEGRLPPALVRRLHELADGDLLDDATNVLAFGLPGVGKSHAICAVGHALVDRGHPVLFMPTYSLVQELLAAKRNLELPRALRKLDAFAVLILDDVGYIQQSPEEAEILFTLLAERYERRSVFITSNLIFANWDRIFRDQMATAAAIDRLVHHSVLLEFDVPSFRTEHAKRRGKPPIRPPADPRISRLSVGACAPAGAPALMYSTATNRPTTTTEPRQVVGDSLLTWTGRNSCRYRRK